MLQTTLVEGHRQKCGYAAVADLATGQQQLSMCHSVTLVTLCWLHSVIHIHCNATSNCTLSKPRALSQVSLAT